MYQAEYERWLAADLEDADLKPELAKINGNDEEIKMTIARYYSPSDTNIDKVGIVPDLEVSYPKLSDENEKSYVKLMEANVISEYVENHPDMTESDIADYACANFFLMEIFKELLYSFRWSCRCCMVPKYLVNLCRS